MNADPADLPPDGPDEPSADTPASEVVPGTLRHRLNVTIFGVETREGRIFDVALLFVIVLSILIVTLESVASIAVQFGPELRVIEWMFTAVFTVEYGTRLYSARHRLRYALSFFGLVDLLSLIPTYLSVFFVGVHSLLVIRVLRLLRIFRVLKVVRMLGEATTLLTALRSSFAKITVFIGAVMTIVVIIGAVMHLIEGAENGFTSIPRSMYWAVVTLTTVGYGDIAPATIPGQFLAATLMMLGYGILAVPTGIVSAELVAATRGDNTVKCSACNSTGHPDDSNFCRVCGEELV